LTGSSLICPATHYYSPDKLKESEGIRGVFLARDPLLAYSGITSSNRAVNEWNKLPATTISAETVNQFKNQYDKWNESGIPA
jgi:hypothetical protein